MHFKGRLITQGFTQSFGMDYNETYVPVDNFASTCVILSLATQNEWEVEQINIKNMYLNTELTETIYMVKPLGFSLPEHENHICQLLKALYGLKQAG